MATMDYNALAAQQAEQIAAYQARQADNLRNAQRTAEMVARNVAYAGAAAYLQRGTQVPVQTTVTPYSNEGSGANFNAGAV